jgi:hypothetical protein
MDFTAPDNNNPALPSILPMAIIQSFPPDKSGYSIILIE